MNIEMVYLTMIETSPLKTLVLIEGTASMIGRREFKLVLDVDGFKSYLAGTTVV